MTGVVPAVLGAIIAAAVGMVVGKAAERTAERVAARGTEAVGRIVREERFRLAQAERQRHSTVEAPQVPPS